MNDSLSTYTLQRPSGAPQTPPPTARLLVNVFDKVSGNLLVTFSQNVSSEGENKWEELNIGLTAKADVQVEVICENTDKDNKPVFFDNLSVKVQAVPTVLVVQENHYYPFGLGMKGLDWVLPTGKEDKYSYNGKEKQTDFDLGWSDYGARNHDSQIGRFTSVDRFAEKYYSFSSYQYAGNNPIRYIDVNGDSIGYADDMIRQLVEKYTNKTIIKKNGKEVANKHYNAGFASIIEKLKDSEDMFFFSLSEKSVGSEGGEVSFDGSKVNIEIGDPGAGYGAGVDGILFEEVKHADQVLGGKVFFSKTAKGTWAAHTSITTEAEAKLFVIDNLDIATKYTDNDYSVPTQLGIIKGLRGKHTEIANYLKNGGVFNVYNSKGEYGKATVGAAYPNIPIGILPNPFNTRTKNEKYFAYPRQ